MDTNQKTTLTLFSRNTGLTFAYTLLVVSCLGMGIGLVAVALTTMNPFMWIGAALFLGFGALVAARLLWPFFRAKPVEIGVIDGQLAIRSGGAEFGAGDAQLKKIRYNLRQMDITDWTRKALPSKLMHEVNPLEFQNGSGQSVSIWHRQLGNRIALKSALFRPLADHLLADVESARDE